MSALKVTESHEVATTPLSETTAVLSMIERVAKDPTVDIDRVERMLTLHRELRKEEAERGFNAAMVAVQAKLPQVKRDAKNKETHSTYARLETICAAVDPIVAGHGLSLSYGTEVSPLANHYRIVCDVRHGAHKERYFVDIPIDGTGPKGTKNKSDTHAFGSTISYARRYLKLMIFDIALTNEDNDGNRQEREPEHGSQRELPRQPSVPQSQTIESAQVEQLREAIKSAGVSENYVLRSGEVVSLSEIKTEHFAAALKFIQNAGARNGR